MNRDFLKNLFKGLGLESDTVKGIIDSIMDKDGEQKSAHKTALEEEREKSKKASEALEGKLKTANEQLEEATKASKAFDKFKDVDVEKLQTDLADANKKLETIEDEHGKAVSALNLDIALMSKTSGLNFSSERAKKSFIADLKSQIKLDDKGEIEGFDDLIKTKQKEEPDVFAAVAAPPKNEGVKHNSGTSEGDTNGVMNKLIRGEGE